MLDIAINHKDQLLEKFRRVWFRDEYWNNVNYYEEWNAEESTWNCHQFVSVDLSGRVIGYIGYRIDRPSDYVYNLNIINFSDNKVIFGLDVGQALQDIFEKFHFRKMNFVVVIGNPVEHTYDRVIQKYGGRIVGIRKQQVRLIDGQFYDEKLYEILANDYFAKKGGNQI